MGNEQTYTVDCGCCTPVNPCVSGDPPLEVTISWSTAPTGNSGWEATTTGKLDMFGETWANGEMKLICPTVYQFIPPTSVTGAGGGVVWRGPNTEGNIRFLDGWSAGGRNPSSPSIYQSWEEVIRTRDNRYADVGLKYTYVGPPPPATLFTLLLSGMSVNSGMSITEGTNNFGPPLNFNGFGGSITTNETVTITWAKSAFFPAGNA